MMEIVGLVILLFACFNIGLWLQDFNYKKNVESESDLLDDKERIDRVIAHNLRIKCLDHQDWIKSMEPHYRDLLWQNFTVTGKVGHISFISPNELLRALKLLPRQDLYPKDYDDVRVLMVITRGRKLWAIIDNDGHMKPVIDYVNEYRKKPYRVD